MKKILYIILVTLLIEGSAYSTCNWVGNVGTADTASQADCAECVSEITGMTGTVTINIPDSGGATSWSSGVTIDMTDESNPAPNFTGVTKLIIAGAGKTATLLTNAISSTTPIFTIVAPSGKAVDISGIGFTGHATVAKSNGEINVYGGSKLIRIHDNDFTSGNAGGRGIKFGDYTDTTRTIGLVDNNTFTKPAGATAASYQSISPFFNSTNLATAWADALSLGTADAIYVENNTFTYVSQSDGMLDAYSGARYVVRYNDINGTVVGHHGLDSGSISTHSYEVYNNAFDNPNTAISSGVMRIRGGTGVIYGNVITSNYSGNMIWYMNYRSDPQFEGTHTGGTSSTTLTDSAANFLDTTYGTITSAWRVYNITDYPALCNGSLTIDDANNISCTLTGGARNNWQSGDEYAIVNYYNAAAMCMGTSTYDGNTGGRDGYPCSQQVGRTGSDGITAAPAYAWSNDFVGNTSPTSNVRVNHTTLDFPGRVRLLDHIQSGVDFYDNTPHPTYTAYGFHPLAGTGTLDPNTAGKAGYHLSGAGNTHIGSGAALTIGVGPALTIN